MNGLLFTGGEGPGAALLDGFLKNTSVIVAADSGYDLAADLGIVPDLVVGDMDSVKRVQEVNQRAPASLIRFPRDKDETDTEIGLSWFDTRDTGSGTFLIAQITLTEDAKGAISGTSYDIDTAGVGVPIERLWIDRGVIVPEPAILILLAVGAPLLRRAHSR